MHNPTFRQDIQGLRGVAVLLVVLYHAELGWFKAGYLGVDIFFVISGFLITSLIVSQILKERFSFRKFYYRRAKRILPAAYVVIALTTLSAPLFLSDLALRDLAQQVVGAVTFTANIVLWSQTGYFAEAADTKPLLHFWSLSVEEQYYLILPALLFFVPRRWWKITLSALLLASALLCIFMVVKYPLAAFYFLPTRFWEMAIGSMATLMVKNSAPTSRLGPWRLPALALLLAIPIFPTALPHPGTNAALVCLATAILLVSPTPRMQAIRPFAFIGDFSYSLYLVHWPVLLYVRAAWLVEAPPWAIYSAVALSLILAWLLFRFVEEPFRRGTFETKRLAGSLLASTVLVGLLPTVLIAARAGERDFDKLRQRNLGLGSNCTFRAGAPPTHVPEACETSLSPELLVWGDSYAMALVPGLAKTAGAKGVAQMTMSACGPTLGGSSYGKGPSPRYSRAFAEDCIAFNESVLAILRNRNDIKVVALSSPFSPNLATGNRMLLKRDGRLVDADTSAQQAVEGLRALATAVRHAGKRVVIVAPPPNIAVDFSECVERKARGRVMLGDYTDCKIPYRQYQKERQFVLSFLEKVNKEADIDIIYLSDFLCDSKECITEYGGKLIYRDTGHLSYEGSEIVAQKANLFDLVMRIAR